MIVKKYVVEDCTFHVGVSSRDPNLKSNLVHAPSDRGDLAFCDLIFPVSFDLLRTPSGPTGTNLVPVQLWSKSDVARGSLYCTDICLN